MQPLNTNLFISVIVLGSIIVPWKDSQFLNAASFIFIIPLWNAIFSNFLQLTNALNPIQVTLLGNSPSESF